MSDQQDPLRIGPSAPVYPPPMNLQVLELESFLESRVIPRYYNTPDRQQIISYTLKQRVEMLESRLYVDPTHLVPDPLDPPALAKQAVALCLARGWSLERSSRAEHLFTEVAELFEAVRGKRGDPVEEAADVMFVLFTVLETNAIAWSQVMLTLKDKMQRFETRPPYAGEDAPNRKPTA